MRKFQLPQRKNFWLGILSFLLLLVGLTTVSILVQRKQEVRKKAVNYNAVLSLVTLEPNPQVGDNFDVNLILNPGGQEVVAVDAVLSFNKSLLEVVDINIAPGLSTNFKTFAPVNTSGNFDKAQIIAQANNAGILSFGALTFDWTADAVTNPVNAVVNPLATIIFKAKIEGSSTISFCFKNNADDSCQEAVIQGSTPDTNIVNSNGNDVLGTADSIVIEAESPGGPTATPTPTTTPISTPTPTPTVTPAQPTNTPTPIPPTPTPESTKGNLTFKIKFQGINNDKGGKKVKITLRSVSGDDQVDDDFDVVHESGGVYNGTLYNLDPGTYTVFVKGWAHLQKNLGDIELIANQTVIKDGSGEILKAGDFNDDNQLDIDDVGAIIGIYTALSVPINDTNRQFDINGDNIIDITDVSNVLFNYTALTIPGDE